MNNIWAERIKSQEEIFVCDNWQLYPSDKVKSNRLPTKYIYFVGGDVSLRAGIIISTIAPREDEFLTAGIQWANRLGNGTKTVLYFIAPDFSCFFICAMNKIGGSLLAKSVYWKEKLTPCLYLVPERISKQQNNLGQKSPGWQQWNLSLNPVAQQQLKIMLDYFAQMKNQGIWIDVRQQGIHVNWGNIEIAAIKKRGKKIELVSKSKWCKDQEKSLHWKKVGWVDLTGNLNKEFRLAINEMISFLETEYLNKLHLPDKLKLLMVKNEKATKQLWGESWIWPWLPKERSDIWTGALGQLYYFHGHNSLKIIFPILDRPLQNVCLSILLLCVLENSNLLINAKNQNDELLSWNREICWLTNFSAKPELLFLKTVLRRPEQFKVCIMPDDWASGEQNFGAEEPAGD